jgi:hypothetical protein
MALGLRNRFSIVVMVISRHLHSICLQQIWSGPAALHWSRNQSAISCYAVSNRGEKPAVWSV